MSATPITFTINGTTVEIPAVCADYPLDRINADNPYWTRDALGAILQAINFHLPPVISEVAQTIADQIDGGGGAGGGPDTPDGIWLANGFGLPAGALGGEDGEDVVGHINLFSAAGSAPGTYQATPVAPAGAYVQVMLDVRQDPVRHLASGGAAYTHAAKPFTCGHNWLSYDAVADQLYHSLPNPHASAHVFGGAGSYLCYLAIDDFHHVVTATPVSMPPTSYTAGHTWISIDEPNRKIYHSMGDGANSGSFAAGANSAIGTLYYDTYHHVTSFAPVATGGAYTGELPWISLVGTEFRHGTTAAISTSFTSTSAAISALYRDAKNHAVSAAYVHIPSVSPGHNWISIAAAGGDYTIYHGPVSAVASAAGGAGSYIQYVGWDAFGHVVTATPVAGP